MKESYEIKAKYFKKKKSGFDNEGFKTGERTPNDNNEKKDKKKEKLINGLILLKKSTSDPRLH